MQVVICSATLHSPEIVELADKIANNPTCMRPNQLLKWDLYLALSLLTAACLDSVVGVDLKGKDSVPDTVDHAIILADPVADQSWKKVRELPFNHVFILESDL